MEGVLPARIDRFEISIEVDYPKKLVGLRSVLMLLAKEIDRFQISVEVG